VFKAATKRNITWPVTVNVPQDGGKVKAHPLDVEFEVLTMTESEESVQRGEDLLDRVVQGWGRYVDENDQAIAFGAEAKKKFLEDQPTRTALFTAYGEIQSGRAARKN